MHAKDYQDTLRQGTRGQHEQYQNVLDRYMLHEFGIASPAQLDSVQLAAFWKYMTDGHKSAQAAGGVNGPPVQDGKAWRAIVYPRMLVCPWVQCTMRNVLQPCHYVGSDI
jgi:hypothetical protein